MKKRLLFISLLTAVALLSLLFLNSAIDNPNNSKNGFQRKFVPDIITKIKVATFENAFRDICAVDAEHIYFSTYIPGAIAIADSGLNALDTISLHLPVIEKLAPVFYTTIEYPRIYILGGNLRAIIHGNLKTNTYEISHLNTGPFSNGIAIGPELFMFRSIDTASLLNRFTKLRLKDNTIQVEKELSPKVNDAGFSYDGKLNYDPITRLLLYVCRYSNRITCFDTAFQLVYNGHTIDTSLHPKVSIVHVGSSVTHRTPPITVNQGSCAYGGVLFVRSALKADNEAAVFFRDNSVIDMYDEKSGIYQGSFYVPIPNGEKLIQFMVAANHRIIILYDKQIIMYRFKTV